jgi:hypothetical protein
MLWGRKLSGGGSAGKDYTKRETTALRCVPPHGRQSFPNPYICKIRTIEGVFGGFAGKIFENCCYKRYLSQGGYKMSIRARAMGLTARPLPSLRGEEKQLPSPEAPGEGQGVRAIKNPSPEAPGEGQGVRATHPPEDDSPSRCRLSFAMALFASRFSTSRYCSMAFCFCPACSYIPARRRRVGMSCG